MSDSMALCFDVPPEKTSGGSVAMSDAAQRACLPELVSRPSLCGHSGSVYGVAFTKDGARVATGSWDGTTRLWDVSTGTELHCLQWRRAGTLTRDLVSCVSVGPDGSIACGRSDVRLWNPESASPVRTLGSHCGRVRSVAHSPNGLLLASGGSDDTVRIWDTRTGNEMRVLKPRSATVRSVAFSADGMLLAAGTESPKTPLLVWGTHNWELKRHLLRGHIGWVSSVAFGGRDLLASGGGQDFMVKVWFAESGVLVRTLKGHTSSVWAVTFSPSGLLCSVGGCTVCLWDALGGTALCCLEQLGKVQCVAFGRSGSLLAIGVDKPREYAIDLYDVRSAEPVENGGGAETEPVRDGQAEADAEEERRRAEEERRRFEIERKVREEEERIRTEERAKLEEERRRWEIERKQKEEEDRRRAEELEEERRRWEIERKQKEEEDRRRAEELEDHLRRLEIERKQKEEEDRRRAEQLEEERRRWEIERNQKEEEDRRRAEELEDHLRRLEIERKQKEEERRRAVPPRPGSELKPYAALVDALDGLNRADFESLLDRMKEHISSSMYRDLLRTKQSDAARKLAGWSDQLSDRKRWLAAALREVKADEAFVGSV